MLTDGRTDDRQNVITIAHLEHSSGELKTSLAVSEKKTFKDYMILYMYILAQG